jgi:CDP-paratose 2-epimerase
VSTSAADPWGDRKVNLGGTLNALEAVRRVAPQAPFFFTSIYRVYGGMEDLSIIRRGERYDYEDLPAGIGEETPWVPSPPTVAPNGADQYVLEHARSYRLKTVVFRMSCLRASPVWERGSGPGGSLGAGGTKRRATVRLR